MALTRPTLAQLTTGIARISDPITTLHQGATSANVDVGFLFNRANGLVSNVALYWSESAQSMVTAYTDGTGESNSNISVSSYAPLTVGNLISYAGVYATNFNFANGLPFVSSTYSNANVTAYLPTDSTITAIQANITAANTAIVTANSAVVSYVNSLNSSMIGNVDAANSAIVTANTAMKGYVDEVTTAWTSNAGGQQTQINTLQSQVYSNSNVSAYLTSSGSGNVTISSGAITLTATGPGAVNVGSSTSIPTIVTDAYGRIVSLTSNAVSTTISLAGTSGTGSVSGGETLTFAGGSGVTAAASGSTVTISTPQDIRTTASPIFASATTVGNLTVGGNLIVTGNLSYLNTEQLSINDTLIYLAQSNPADLYDIGFVGHRTTSAYQHLGIIRDHTDGVWKFFSNISAEPTANVITFDSTTTYDAVKMGNLFVANSTPSTSTSTGALIVSGGAGIAANLWAGNLTTTTAIATNFVGTHTGTASITSGSVNGTTVGATTTSTGAFTSLSASGPLYVSNSTTSTSSNTGAAIVAGGLGIAGNVYSNAIYTNGLYWAGNNAVISTGGGGGGTGITYTASATAPSTPTVGDQWYYTTGDILYEYQNVGTGSFWIDITSPTIASGTVTVPGGDAFSPFLLMGA